MKLTDYEYDEQHNIFQATKEGWNEAGVPGALSGACQYVGNNKVKSVLFPTGAASFIFTAANVKAGCIGAAEASGFFAKTSSYLVGVNEAMAASMPGFMGKGMAANVFAGVIMAIAAASTTYVLFKGAEKVYTYLTDAKTVPVNPSQQQKKVPGN